MRRRIIQSNHKTIYIDNSNGKPTPKEISKGYIISLEKERATRLSPLLENLRHNTKIQFDVLDAIDGTKIENKSIMCDGALGCILSHVEAIKKAKEEQLPAILILEDDALIVDGFDAKLAKIIKEAGIGWDAIWLGGINDKQTNHSDNLNVTLGNWSTYGYILRETVYNYSISGLGSLITTADDWYRKFLHPKYLCFKTKEELVYHRSDLPSTVNPGKDWSKHPLGSKTLKMNLTKKVIE